MDGPSPSETTASKINRPQITCSGCDESIAGTRYQCAECPSGPKPFSLCSRCEERSYAVHDPMHIFFKLARPLDQFPELALPKLYLSPAGPPDGALNEASPTAYLQSLVHSNVGCDGCSSIIKGRWFRCVSCAKDFCEACEQSDVHDDTHVSLVFKSTVDLLEFTHFVGVEMPVCWRDPRSNS